MQLDVLGNAAALGLSLLPSVVVHSLFIVQPSMHCTQVRRPGHAGEWHILGAILSRQRQQVRINQGMTQLHHWWLQMHDHVITAQMSMARRIDACLCGAQVSGRVPGAAEHQA